ncbi:CbtA family protein [Pseudomonas sp.]|uniref:CbtA family protein n=1 Tax=Pseudomonas sp. TaxID=306 RepID=UPI002735A5BD|nr:CbtA family protein [Pseudomonas sp.]MDP3815647.1 CbtA family protein [Pseudomonas sp.]
MIKRIAQTAGFSGLLAALLLTLLQSLWVTPLILEAETYENAEPVAEHSHAAEASEHQHAAEAEAVAHEHDEDSWAPQDGLQRSLFTGLSNLVIAVGFALMLAGLYSLRAPGNSWQGLLWGLAGFATFNLAPAAGLPPELPGTAAAELLLRQYWWIGTAATTAAGLALLAFARPWWLRLLGLALVPLPHLIGAPHPQVHESLAPEALGQQFIYASLLSNALFWAALGLVSAWLFTRPQPAN